MKLNLLRSVRSLISLVCKMINRCCRPLIYPKNTFEEKIICSLFSNLIIDLSTLFLIFNYREWRRVDNSKKYGSALEIGWFEKFFILQYRYHIHMHFSANKFQFLVTMLHIYYVYSFVQYHHVVQKCNNVLEILDHNNFQAYPKAKLCK